MGCGQSGGTDARTRELDSELAGDKKASDADKKLLLLGTGGSGKSTFFKQLKSIHGTGFTQLELTGYKQQVHRQILESMQTLLYQCDLVKKLHGDGTDAKSSDDVDTEEAMDEIVAGVTAEDALQFIIGAEFDSTIKEIEKLNFETEPMTPDIATQLSSLWKCSAVRGMFDKHRNKLSVADSTKVFLDDIHRIGGTDYTPTEEDVLLVRYRTTGMHEKTFVINETRLKVVDVGGQRNERKKWIHFFDGVTAVIFVVSLACYDEIPFEEVADLEIDIASKNNMVEALTVFRETLANPVFVKIPFILFLNKSDIFREKVTEVPITLVFKDYTGPNEFEPASDFIQQQFVAQNQNENRDIFAHKTCATDKGNVKKVFDDVQIALVNMNLADADLF